MNLEDKTTGPPKTSWTSASYHSEHQRQVTLDTTALDGTVGQSMLQLARAQENNRHLQQHLQQGQMNMQAHGALQQLATTYQ